MTAISQYAPEVLSAITMIGSLAIASYLGKKLTNRLLGKINVWLIFLLSVASGAATMAFWMYTRDWTTAAGSPSLLQLAISMGGAGFALGVIATLRNVDETE